MLYIFFCTGCGDKYSHSKFYDYVIDNQLQTHVIKIVPLTKSSFWITSADTFYIYPQTHSIVGSTDGYDNNKRIVDKYSQNDTIERFEVFIDNIKQEKNFTQRLNWTFSYGSVDESAIYTLTINQNNIITK